MENKTKNKNLVVMGLFAQRVALENAITDLRSQGFRSADISALLPSNETTKELGHIKTTKLPEGAATGGVAGAAVGGTLGWLAGIGSLAIPGLGALIAAGPIVGLLAGLGAGGAVGTLTGGLVGLGFPEYEAKRFEGFVKEGGYLLSVHCDNNEWENKAQTILESAGATDVSRTSEASSDSHDSVTKDIPRNVSNV